MASFIQQKVWKFEFLYIQEVLSFLVDVKVGRSWINKLGSFIRMLFNQCKFRYVEATDKKIVNNLIMKWSKWISLLAFYQILFLDKVMHKIVIQTQLKKSHSYGDKDFSAYYKMNSKRTVQYEDFLRIIWENRTRVTPFGVHLYKGSHTNDRSRLISLIYFFKGSFKKINVGDSLINSFNFRSLIVRTKKGTNLSNSYRY